MKLLRILSFVAILGLAFTSCSKDDSNDQPTPAKKQLVKISSTTTYVGDSRIDKETLNLNYDTKGLLSEVTSSKVEGSDPVINRTFSYSYNEQGKVSKITFNCDGESTVNTISYSGSKRTILQGANYPDGNEYKIKTEQDLNSEGKPIKEQAYNYKDGQWVKYYGQSSGSFEWSNGNLTKTVDHSGSTTVYQYDAKKGLGLNLDAIWFTDIEYCETLGHLLDYVRPNLNNMLKVVTTNGSEISTTTYKNTYDTDGYLIKVEVNYKSGNEEENTTIEYTYK